MANNIKGNVFKSPLKLSDDHKINMTSKTLVTLSENILTIKGVPVTLPFGNYTSPQIFYINDTIYISITNVLNESIKGIRIIKAYCRQNFALEKAFQTINKIKDLYIKSTKISSRISPLMEFIGSLAVAVAIWGGGSLILNESMTTLQFMFF